MAERPVPGPWVQAAQYVGAIVLVAVAWNSPRIAVVVLLGVVFWLTTQARELRARVDRLHGDDRAPAGGRHA